MAKKTLLEAMLHIRPHQFHYLIKGPCQPYHLLYSEINLKNLSLTTFSAIFIIPPPPPTVQIDHGLSWPIKEETGQDLYSNTVVLSSGRAGALSIVYGPVT